MIRYALEQRDIKWLYSKPTTDSKKFAVKFSPDIIFVDILWRQVAERCDEQASGDWAQFKLYYSDGDIVVGWTGQMQINCPLRIVDTDSPDQGLLPNALFDGQFNS